MAECKNCGRPDCDSGFNGHWDVRRWADDSNSADCIAHTVDWSARALAAEAEAVAEKQHREFTVQWYAERLERLKDLAKERGFWHEMSAIIANGTATHGEPNDYATLLQCAKFRAERAEEKQATAESRILELEGDVQVMCAAVTRINQEVLDVAKVANATERGMTAIWAWWEHFLHEDVPEGDTSGSRYPIDKLEPDTQQVMRGFQRLRDDMKATAEKAMKENSNG